MSVFMKNKSGENDRLFLLLPKTKAKKDSKMQLALFRSFQTDEPKCRKMNKFSKA